MSLSITEGRSRAHHKAVQSARNMLVRYRYSVSLYQDLLANIVSTFLSRASLAEAEASSRTAIITRHLNCVYVVMLPLLVLQGCFTMVPSLLLHRRLY